ncbi:NAD-dependent epimerase/dehydratase family protein [Frateuria sp. MAH-13]|uniref:NAD-dependent epimerase/dehydratase family protein n=1 Tax=Frateuria flava TaxID=2821489 RepID=A0ABS4DI80_9GAMM|nr:NAD-dependent epimerase/dehydratase family protein [Frateuria flava]MBP1472760.1 NAD-dependent epimerase/dehydratase family protein [Frateuria flava]
MRILITGATGLVGQGVLRECLRAPDVAQVVALVRHATGIQDARLEELLCPDFAKVEMLGDRLAGFDACLYCAGAPLVGITAEAYRHVTLTLTLKVAEAFARHNPEGRFLYISGAYSDPGSRMMVARAKGETERALEALPITTVMLRPGGIRPVEGIRSSHKPLDLLYRLGSPALALAVHLLPGQMTTTARVGRAMLALARDPSPPPVVENDAINRLGREPSPTAEAPSPLP